MGCSFNVVVTVRTKEKGQRILESLEGLSRDNVSYVVVEDITAEGAFDAVAQHTSIYNPIRAKC
jgi:hypothetical protein